MATGTVVDVVMPQMGVSVSEGTVTKWLKNVGDTIAGRRAAARDLDRQGRHRGAEPRHGRAAGDPRPGGRDGRRRDARRADRAPAESRPRAPGRSPRRCPASVEPEPVAEPEPEPVRRAGRGRARACTGSPPAAPGRLSGNGSGGERHTFVSPVVARIAAEHGIDPSTVTGTGRDGRVTKKDILAFVESGAAPAAAAPAAAPARRSAALPPRRLHPHRRHPHRRAPPPRRARRRSSPARRSSR